jgi:penicillin-binding protein 1A
MAAPARPIGRPPSGGDVGTAGGGGEPPPDGPLLAAGDGGAGGDGSLGGDDQPPRKPRVRKLRLLAIVVGLGALAFVSTVFGMMMAVASDLPQLENRQQYRHEENSFLYDDTGKAIGILAPPTHTVVIQRLSDISPWMRKAVVAVEDKRFWAEPGVDVQGIGRALITDVTGGSHQGASTIAEQFVKNALSEQNNRTVFEKLREATLAFHLTHRWAKAKVLREYLNSIYFGSGAYGIESAARVYFGKALGYDANAAIDGSTGGCGDSTPSTKRPTCASKLHPWQAALLAGMISSPAQYDPIAHPRTAMARRNAVLSDMLQAHDISQAQYHADIAQPLPTTNDLQQPAEPSAAPYFTSWLRPQILGAMGLGHGVSPSVAEYRAYYGGLKIHTSLDLGIQQAADQAVEQTLPYSPGQPTVSLVSIDNKTGGVRAMIGGPVVNGHEDYAHHPFNLAAEGHRQPGSSFKPFTLAVALESGIGPDSVWTSAPQDFIVPKTGGKEHFIVHNFGNSYSGSTSLQGATDVSDNSVFAQVGIQVGTSRVAHLAKQMGIRSPVSNNYAMILGGLRIGVSPLDMAHAYQTFATGGLKVFNPLLGSPNGGPIGIDSIDCNDCAHTGIPAHLANNPELKRILPADVAGTVQQMLQGPVQSGTATQAAISGVMVAGKTGTTSNYGDAWFVGWTPQLTTAVWVGYPDKLVPMNTQYAGGPVEGGTWPAIIWHAFMVQALQILQQRQQSKNGGQNTTSTETTPAPPPSVTPIAPSTATAPVAPSTATAPVAPSAPATTTPAVPNRTTPTAPAPVAPNPTPSPPPAAPQGTPGTSRGTTGVTPRPTPPATGNGAPPSGGASGGAAVPPHG